MKSSVVGTECTVQVALLHLQSSERVSMLCSCKFSVRPSNISSSASIQHSIHTIIAAARAFLPVHRSSPSLIMLAYDTSSIAHAAILHQEGAAGCPDRQGCRPSSRRSILTARKQTPVCDVMETVLRSLLDIIHSCCCYCCCISSSSSSKEQLLAEQPPRL